MSIALTTPIPKEQIDSLHVGDVVVISGNVLAGRDAVLPKVCKMIGDGSIDDSGIELEGGVVFHTAVSGAGVGPTSSNKVEIEGSFEKLSQAGVRVHLGKGSIKPETVEMLAREHSCFAVIPPITALLGEKTLSQKVIAYPELGMEALHNLVADGYPAIIAAVNGESMFEGEEG